MFHSRRILCRLACGILVLWCWLYAGLAQARCDVEGFIAERQVGGLFVRPGLVAPPSAANRGLTQNAILIFTQGKGILLDPGPSIPAMEAVLLSWGRECPLHFAVNSHPHPENVLANHALPQAVPILSSQAVLDLMTLRCPGCQSRFQSQLGLPPDRQAPIRLPQPFGQASGMTPPDWPASLIWMDMGAAHSGADVVLFERERGLLLTGALAQCGVVPELAEGDIRHWIASLRQLERLAVRGFIGSQGGYCGGHELIQTRRYLEQLLRQVQEDVRALGDPATADQRIAMSDFSAWALYADRHGLNVQRLYRLLELEAQQPAR